jgi:hypothetical protein
MKGRDDGKIYRIDFSVTCIDFDAVLSILDFFGLNDMKIDSVATNITAVQYAIFTSWTDK